MTKLTNGIFLGSILGLFLSIVVYFFAPDLYPVYRMYFQYSSL